MSAIRDAEPDVPYTVGLCDYEALWTAVNAALFIQEIELQKMSEYFRPTIVQFVATEQLQALADFSEVVDKVVDWAPER
ncbi:MAG TPA: hypothetical protein VK701_06060 [Solirubrobacteraceae bacterium]|nr:hypothetical protein [Solirubrobacteraceae bacterium]